MDDNLQLIATLHRMEMAKPHEVVFRTEKCRPVVKGEIFLYVAGKKIKIQLPEKD
jgi:hypothetical protein